MTQPRDETPEMVAEPEHEFALRLANKVLDRVSGDPDDDLAVLARQLLRRTENIAQLSAALEPFARLGNAMSVHWRDDYHFGLRDSDERLIGTVNVSDLRRAAAIRTRAP